MNERCACCGVAATMRQLASNGRCCLCHVCHGSHAKPHYEQICKLVKLGRIEPWHAMAMCAVEDAWITGVAAIDSSGIIVAPRPVERWEVMLAWYRCAGQNEVPVAELVEVAMLPWVGVRNTMHVRDEITASINRAMRSIFPTYLGCEVSAKGGDVTSGEIVVNMQMSENALPVMTTLVPDVEVPPDILNRKHAEA